MIQEVELKHKHSYSDEYRVQCAVRQLLIWRENWGLQKFRKYLSENKIDSKILNMVADQWQKGNRGDTWI